MCTIDPLYCWLYDTEDALKRVEKLILGDSRDRPNIDALHLVMWYQNGKWEELTQRIKKLSDLDA